VVVICLLSLAKIWTALAAAELEVSLEKIFVHDGGGLSGVTSSGRLCGREWPSYSHFRCCIHFRRRH
jgi:hypothetical protein